MRERTEAFGVDSTALQWVDGPVVILESVHQLQDGAHAADGGVDGGGANELRRQVSVEGQLDLRAHTMKTNIMAKQVVCKYLWSSLETLSWPTINKTGHKKAPQITAHVCMCRIS